MIHRMLRHLKPAELAAGWECDFPNTFLEKASPSIR